MEYSPKNSFCKKCKLYKRVINPCVIGRGNIHADILLLGEANGQREDELGQPFVGRSGEFLQYYLNNIGIDCFISNSLICRPIDDKGNNKKPTPTEIECCKPFTIDVIRRVKPKVVVAIGSVAMKQLLKLNLNVEVSRGKIFYHPELNVYVVPTYHPAYILRNPNENKFKSEFATDLQLVKNIATRPPTRRIPSKPVTLEDPLDIKKYLEEVLLRDSVAIDLETTGLNPRKDKITDISLCIDIGKGVHIEWPRVLEYRELLNEILLSDKITKIYHNAVFDIACFRANGFDVKLPMFDVMIAYHTLTMSYEGGQAASLYKLKTMAWLMTQEGGYEEILEPYGGIVGVQKMIETMVPKEVPQQNSLYSEEEIAKVDDIDRELENNLMECATYIENIKNKKLEACGLEPKIYYSAMDADVTYRIYKYLKYRIDKDYSFVYYNIIIPLTMCLIRMHESGVNINRSYVEKLIVENKGFAEETKKDFFKSVGREININSQPQLSELIYNTLGVKPDNRFLTKKGKKPSTDEAALLYYSKQKPVLKKILKYRGINKETSTYLEGYRKLLDENDKVYPQYLQIGTATGRLSCISPNLQNIPRDNRIRNIVIPSKGCKLIVADLSQVELRVLAMVACDQAMINAFESGHDFHTYTACTMFGIYVDAFDKENKDHNEKRSAAKTINFGMVYQRRAETLATDLGISIEKANGFMHKFFTSYPNVARWIINTKNFARTHGYVETLYGRRRYLPNINSSDQFKRESAERQSINTPIQSCAGDISYFGIIRTQDYIDTHNKESKIIGTVHDSMLLDVPFDEIDEIAAVIPDLMTKNIPRVTIELKADVDILDKWIK